MRRGRLRAVAIVSVLIMAVGACSSHRKAAPSNPWTDFGGLGDPMPAMAATGVDVTDGGGTVHATGVDITVPPGALAAGHKATVRTGSMPADARQRFGQPVGVDHDVPLAAPLTVAWTIPADLPAHERETAILVHWSATDHVWQPLDVRPTLTGTVLSAKLTDFSIIDWVSDVDADASQSILQRFDARVAAPTCAGGAMPGWVRQVVDPDENAPAAAIRFCTEPDKGDVVTARIADNRSFTQQITLTPADQKWAWNWTGSLDASVSGLVYRAAQQVLDNSNRVIVPPLATIAVGIDRPSTPGQIVQTGTATVTPLTMLADVVAYVADQMDKYIGKNPLFTAYLQDFLECGGDAALSLNASHALSALLHDVIDVVGGCAGQMIDHRSKYGAAFEDASRALIAKGGATAAAVVDANRMMYQLSAAYRALQFAEIAFYVSDQLANAAVGPLAFSIRGDGRPQVLGAWKPGCASTGADSKALYRNLALQDTFADHSKELWQFSQWQPSARTAVAPLSACGLDYLQRLAAFLPGDWGDPKAATVVAGEIRRLTPFATLPTTASLLAAHLCVKPCTIIGQVFLNHPGFGPIDVLAIGPGGTPGPVYLLAVDPAGKVRWSYRNEHWYALRPNSPATDKTGNLFFVYNPGRYDGVIILVPAATGFDDLHTLPAFDDYQERFYSAATSDPHRTGTLQIVVSANDCDPDCAGGTIWMTPYTWNGHDYIRPASPCPTGAQLIHEFVATTGNSLIHGRVDRGGITCQDGWAFAGLGFDFADGTASDGAMTVWQFTDNIWTRKFAGTGALFWGQDPLCDQMPKKISDIVCVHA